MPLPDPPQPAGRGPLAGTRVVDLSTSYAGPTAAMYLADLGADVIKIERPHGGDDSRAWGPPFVGEDSAWFYSANRGKRSIALDLGAAAGREIMHRMIGAADVLVESLSAAALQRLDLSPEVVRARHPRLVYCAISGFGLTGPDSGLRGYDLIAQARSGLMSVTGDAGVPQRVSTALSDVVAGMVAALAVTAAVVRQRATGEGDLVDVSLLDADLAIMAPRIASFLAGEPEPRPSGGTDSVLAVYQTFPTADRPIVVAVGNDRIWTRFCDVIGAPELAADPRLATNRGRRAHRTSIVTAIRRRLSTRNAEHWLQRLIAAGVPASRVHALSDVVKDPQVRARNSLRVLRRPDGPPVTVVASPWRLGSQPAAESSAAPRLGQHTREILREHGLSDAETKRLLQADVVAVPTIHRDVSAAGGDR